MSVSRSTLNWGRGGAARKNRSATWSVRILVSRFIVVGCKIVSVYCLIFDRAQLRHSDIRTCPVAPFTLQGTCCLCLTPPLSRCHALFHGCPLMRSGSSAISVAGAVPSEERRAAGGQGRAQHEHCSCILGLCCECFFFSFGDSKMLSPYVYKCRSNQKGVERRNAHFHADHSARSVHAQCTLRARYSARSVHACVY